jgi:hypothetical protein
MFKTAAAMYWNLLCNIGGGNGPHDGKSLGFGCLLTPNHFITANHCVTEALSRYSFLVALTHKGLSKCKPVWSSEDHDLCVLLLEDILDPRHVSECPTSFPSDFRQAVSWGSTVGYISAFSRADESGETNRYTFFSSAEISFLARGDGAAKFALASGFIESGVSGSPVFLPSGAFVGVIVQSQEVPRLSHRGRIDRVRFPVFSRIWQVAEHIEHAIGL